MQPDAPLIVFSALGQPTRWRIFELLLERLDEGLLHREIAAQLGVDRPLLAVHLKVLRTAGLVAVEKSGRDARYRIAPGPARQASALLSSTLRGAGAG